MTIHNLSYTAEKEQAELAERAVLELQGEFARMSARVGITLHEQLIFPLVMSGVKFDDAWKFFCKGYVLAALRQCKGNQVQAARLIGVHRNTLGRWMKEMG